MSHKHKKPSQHRYLSKSREWLKQHKNSLKDSSSTDSKPKLEIVLKCDSAGSLEAVTASVLKLDLPEVDVLIIHSGVGDIHKSDVLIAETGSRLIIGFQVGIQPGMDKVIGEYGVETRLYDVIYKLTDDIRTIAKNLIPHVPEESIIGSARVIALFKSSRKDIIVGCKVLSGFLALHQNFRVISAMGTVHTGTIESMHIEKNAVQKAVKGQEVGLKIKNFKKAKIGDIIETFRLEKR